MRAFTLKAILLGIFILECKLPGLEKAELQTVLEMQSLVCFSGASNCGNSSQNSSISFSYPQSFYSLQTGSTIASIVPLVSGNPTEFSISPDLVSGLKFNTLTGVITGTPNALISNQVYTVIARNLSSSFISGITITTQIPTACADVTIINGTGTNLDPFQICNPDQLQTMILHHIANPSSHYILQQDLDLSTIVNFDPIGTSVNPFNGVFDGNYHTIFNLKIDRPVTLNVGLFGEAAGGLTTIIRNIRLRNAWVRGNSEVGTLIGNSDNKIEYALSLDGYSRSELGSAGGLVGRNSGAGVVYNSGFTGTVSAVTDYVGGLVGYSFGADEIKKCYSIANVSGDQYVGALVGRQVQISIENSYSQGSVTGTSYVGGLSGRSQFASASISYSYSAAVVSPGAVQGGLVSQITPAVTSSYYDSSITTQSDSDTRGLPRTTNQLKCPTAPNDSCAGSLVYDLWDTAIWDFGNSSSYPKLQWEKDF